MGIEHGLTLCNVTYMHILYITYVPAPGRLHPGFIDINDKTDNPTQYIVHCTRILRESTDGQN